jgi:3-isopropylmalate dehydrogenase
MKFYIALIKGDGIGPEVASEAVRVMERVGERFGRKFAFEELYAGGCAIDRFGEPLPADTLARAKASDAVLLGAVGGWRWDNLPGDQRPERALLELRDGLGLYANLRPAILFEALAGACPLRRDIAEKGVDIMVVRELTGGIYFGDRGRKQTEQGEIAWDTETYSEAEVRRVAEIAFATAETRGGRLTNVDKANVLESSRLWRSAISNMAKDHPGVELNHMYVDNAAMQLVRDPSQFSVIVTSNMFGDILSDEAAQITGSIGMLPSASLGEGGSGMYEPIHGSAPDIAGEDVANPIASILSAAMMLRYAFKLEDEAEAVYAAVYAVLDDGFRTADIMSEGMRRVGTREMGELICERIR